MNAFYMMGAVMQQPRDYNYTVARSLNAVAGPLALIVFLGFWCLVAYAVFSVARWANGSRREREAYYKRGAASTIADTATAGGTASIEVLREQERIAQQRRREGQKLGGLITTAVGIGMMVFVHAMQGPADRNAYLVGLIPLLVGVVLVVYALFLAPKPTP